MTEVNREILTKALAQLPEYTPQEQVWIGIVTELADAPQHETLADALESLPKYSPEDGLWNQIERSLPDPQARNIRTRLHEYQPPASVWEAIEQRLPEQQRHADKPRRRRIVIAAAAAVLLLCIGFFFFSPLSKEQLQYAIEWVDEDQQWQDENEDAFALISVMCADRPPICGEPEFQSLQKELDFLSAALAEIKNNLSPYDDNTLLINALTEIELERNAVAKQMIARLL